ncbi:VanZ family protein [Peribacillus butanolivorans]|uniref:VanZ family protein n=1 Tax=Peribacillus butanolivorans TaxID=421767 RepID=UPI0035DEACBD
MRFNGDIVIILGFLCYLIFRAIILVIRAKRKKTVVWFNELMGLLFILYALMVVSVTLFPLYIGIPHEEFSYRFINYKPLISIFDDISQVGTAYSGDTLFMIKLIVRNVGGNILMFMPLGFLAPVLWGRYRRFKNILMIGLIVSLSIESLQLVENLLEVAMTRSVDIDDVICNTFGAILGYSIYKLLVLYLASWCLIKNPSN